MFVKFKVSLVNKNSDETLILTVECYYLVFLNCNMHFVDYLLLFIVKNECFVKK